MAHVASNGRSIFKQMENEMEYTYQGRPIKAYVRSKLAGINAILSDNVSKKQIFRIDEVAVVDYSGGGILSVAANGRKISIKNLNNLVRQLKIEMSDVDPPAIVCLDGQLGEDFDLLVPVTITYEDFSPRAKYLVFGNSLRGTLADLKRAPEWLVAQNMFYSFAHTLCAIIHFQR